MKRLLLSMLFAASMLTNVSWGEVRLPGFFSDHMVLQREQEIRIWGWADAGRTVTVTLGTDSTTTTANEQGEWRVRFDPQKASFAPVVLRVSEENTVTINDVLVGEVWLCSGQSNMEWTVQSSESAADAAISATHPQIRHFKVAHRPSTTPLDDIQSEWKVCSPETVGSFTGVGYFMARRLHRELGVPVGLINSSWGGTRVEPWTPPIGFQEVASVADIHESVVGRTPGSSAYKQRLGQHIEAMEAWLAKAQDSLVNGSELDASPEYPAALAPFRSHQDPTMLYNGMIHPLVGLPIRGAIWYQGESNHTEGMLYFEKKKALIGGWRKLWGLGDFPFYYVQIAPYQYGSEDPTILAEFWEAQAAVEQLPNTEMVVINDIATLDDIHPPNKKDVGARLAAIALKRDYGRDEFVASSPEFDSLQVLDGGLRLKFKNTAGGLKTRDGRPASHFEVIGKGAGGFQPAVATVSGDTVELTSSSVDSPVAFRFAWHKLAVPNLMGTSGLPVGACRGGDVPEFLDTVPTADDYQLVYELDLGKGNGVEYTVDHSKQIGEFDRVAYLLELESQQFGPQQVFVSAEAFTDDAGKIGVPTVDSGAKFQQTLNSMMVYSSVGELDTGGESVTGGIEFWPHNYATANESGVPNASGSIYDFGDHPTGPEDGYGSMQIHNPAERETIFAINHWKQAANADIGIGNSEGNSRDWTFTRNAATYQKKRLRVFVRPKSSSQTSGSKPATEVGGRLAVQQPPSFSRQFDIIYQKRDGFALTMEKVTPSEANGAAIVMVMSGGWFSNHDFTKPHDATKLPNVFKENATELLQRGYTLFYVVHGTQPKFNIREIHEQVSSAVRHIRFHAAEFGIDPERIGITGGSAGGHLSLMQGTKGLPRDSDKTGIAAVSSKVQAVAAYYPPTDFVNYGDEDVFFDQVVREVQGGKNPFMQALDFVEFDAANIRLKKVTDEDRLAEHFEYVAPRYHVTKDDAPTLLLHGDADRLVPIQQSRLIVEEFVEADVPHKLYLKSGGNHGWPATEAEAGMIADWFDTYLAPK